MALPAAVDFNADVRPVLSNNCFFCHGPDAHERKADLRLDTSEGATRDLGGYAALVPGSLEKSEMWARISSTDRDEIMPPPEAHKVMKPKEREIIKQWILEGAKYEKYWAYEPPRENPVPATGKEWSDHWIDRFVFAKLKEKQLEPSPDADRITLVRRLHFDLTGLPPRPEEVE
ncbi:MAG: c-type cytochrome domain-containing protein, partial [Opitutae bacterium]